MLLRLDRLRIIDDVAKRVREGSDLPKKFRIDLTTERKSLDGTSPEDVVAEGDDVLIGGSASPNPHPLRPRSGEFVRSGFLFLEVDDLGEVADG